MRILGLAVPARNASAQIFDGRKQRVFPDLFRALSRFFATILQSSCRRALSGVSSIVEIQDIWNGALAFRISNLPLATKLLLHFNETKKWSPFAASAVFRQGESHLLRTRRTGNGQVLFTLSGRIETEDIGHLRELFAVERPGRQLTLDLKDVTLVNEDAVKFLGKCEVEGIKLENCPLHVRDWVDQVRIQSMRRGAKGHVVEAVKK